MGGWCSLNLFEVSHGQHPLQKAARRHLQARSLLQTGTLFKEGPTTKSVLGLQNGIGPQFVAPAPKHVQKFYMRYAYGKGFTSEHF